MSEIQRYAARTSFEIREIYKHCQGEPVDVMFPDREGKYMRFSDHLADKAAAVAQAVQEEREKVKGWLRDIMGHREYAECWYADPEGNFGDCGNWPSCNPHCSLREMMDHVGTIPQEDGGLDKQPATRSIQAQNPVEEGKEVEK